MKHLERVITASKRAIVKNRIVENGCNYPQISEDKRKKKAKGSIIDEVKEITDGPVKRDDDRVIWGNLDSKKKNKKGGVDEPLLVADYTAPVVDFPPAAEISPVEKQ